MFSGLTNQFTSLVGAVKGQGDEDVPVPNQDAAPAAAEAPAAAAAAASVAATEAGAAGDQMGEGGEEAGKSGWLGSAKGWLGSASIPSMPAMPSMPSMPAMPAMPSMPSIPGLRKNAGGEGEVDGVAAEGADLAGGAVSAGEDEDKSSATEGADSHPASGGGTPTGDEGQIGQGKGESTNITTKVTQQAKHFGSFLSSAISKAGSKIKETTHIPQTLLESFNKEQEAFMKGQGGADSGMAPWIGHANEAKIKEEILGLSQDRRNFVRAPPAGVDFEFNYDTAYPTAVAIMAEDKALETMRFELVPKIITEENFWRNYFYRVSLIIQAAELGTLGADGVGQASSGEDATNNKNSKAQDIITNVVINNKNEHENAKNDKDNVDEVVVIEKEPKKVDRISESEFVSDAFKTKTPADMEMAEIKDGMRRLGIDSLTQNALNTNDEEQWEKDLEAELRDYEVVCSSSDKKDGTVGEEEEENIPTISNLRTRTTNSDWEEEYADLIEDTDDLK